MKESGLGLTEVGTYTISHANGLREDYQINLFLPLTSASLGYDISTETHGRTDYDENGLLYLMSEGVLVPVEGSQKGISAIMVKKGLSVLLSGQTNRSSARNAKAEVSIEKKTTAELMDELSEVGARLLTETLPLIEKGEITPEKQDDSLSSYAGMIRKEDGRLDFSGETAEEAERKVRAFNPWPGTYFDYGGVQLKVWAAEVTDPQLEAAPGTVTAAGPGGIDIAFKRGILKITEIQAPGKKKMPVDAFLRGNAIEIGRILQ